MSSNVIIVLKISMLVALINIDCISAQCTYEMVWEDSFDGTSLNSSNWSYQLGAGGWGNNELQTYTNTNANVSGGVLQIIAQETAPSEYTSSRIRSIGLRDIKYGKLEARIKLPEGQGIWPAFWMMPSCSVFGGWPTSGEIDIMEYLGHQTSTSYATCHFGNSPIDKDQVGASYTLPSGTFTDDFHLFSIEWSENTIKWFIDNLLILEVDDTDVGSYLYPFNEEFHFILNVAVGGNWPGNPDATTSFPQVMEVDYVRAYQLIQDWTIQGPLEILPNSTNAIYSVPDIPGATYDWYTPSCATLISGQGTNTISLDWAEDSGDIDVVIGLPCETFIISTAVDLSNNITTNSGFEKGKKDWFSNFYNGGSGSFDLVNLSPYNGINHACITVNSLGTDFWNVQFGHQPASVINGQTYTLSFYAKADEDNSHMRVNFRDSNGNASTADQDFYLSDTWTLYQYTYIAPYDIAELALDFNHGFETGQYCYDDITFTLAGPMIGQCPSNFCVEDLVLQNTLIQDATYKAANSITSSSMIQEGQVVELEAGQCILLNPGFESEASVSFSAEIAPCDNN